MQFFFLQQICSACVDPTKREVLVLSDKRAARCTKIKGKPLSKSLVFGYKNKVSSSMRHMCDVLNRYNRSGLTRACLQRRPHVFNSKTKDPCPHKSSSLLFSNLFSTYCGDTCVSIKGEATHHNGCVEV